MATDEQASTSLEIERKYDVSDVQARPAASHAVRWGRAREHRLAAIYLDTDDFTLQRHKITLRRRTGGSDAGWHLKRPGGGDARSELHVPLAAAAAPVWSAPGPVQVPDLLRGELRHVLGERALYQVARLATVRIEHDVLLGDPAAPPLERVVGAVFCDDLVQADVVAPASGRTATSTWREWEVELVGPGDIALLDAVEEVLLAAGGRPAGRASKLARALEPVLD